MSNAARRRDAFAALEIIRLAFRQAQLDAVRAIIATPDVSPDATLELVSWIGAASWAFSASELETNLPEFPAASHDAIRHAIAKNREYVAAADAYNALPR